MSLLTKEQSYIFSSSAAAGATAISADGSGFSVVFTDPLVIPKASVVDCSVGVVQANIWYTSPNISTDFKNNIFEYTTSEAPAGTISLAIPQGLYSLAGLNSYLSSQFVNVGHPANLITISGDDATQKTILTFLTSGDSVDFTVPNSVREILGFNSAVVTAPSNNYNFYSDEPGNFNRVNSYIIKSNLVTGGIQLNSSAQGIIATVPIDVKPGSQITYQPNVVTFFNANELIGTSKNALRFQLLDQDLRPAPTAGEDWSVTVLVKTTTLLSMGTLPLRV